MIILLLVSLIVTVAILRLARRLRLPLRMALAGLAFVVVNAPTLLFVIVGDEPSAGARPVSHPLVQPDHNDARVRFDRK